MALADLWVNAREQLADKRVSQIIAFAGSGKLLDGNAASKEFREFLSRVPSERLMRYADECLTERFDNGGFALQDIINEAGRRLEFRVTNGRYRGSTGEAIGFDGLWQSASGHILVVEVKTTDAYRIDLNTVAGYRRSLAKAGDITEEQSSILMVVGRKDTGDLEAQIRGSRFAWDIRLISMDALFRLLRLKEEVGDPSIVTRITEVLIPREYTKLDGIIDLVFSAAEDAHEGEAIAPEQGAEQEGEAHQPRADRPSPAHFNDACAARVQEVLGKPLVKTSRTGYATPDGQCIAYCLASTGQDRVNAVLFWFAFYPYQRERLNALAEGYVVLGCGSEREILLVPFRDFAQWLEGLSVTERGAKGFYWHIHVYREDGRYLLHLKRPYSRVDLTKYLVPERSTGRRASET